MERINFAMQKEKESGLLCYEPPNVCVFDLEQDVITTSQLVQYENNKTFSDYLDDGWF